MGKPYQLEMSQLSETIRISFSLDISQFSSSLIPHLALPMLTLGSGGSFTAAQYMATLHEYYSGKLARPITPLELAFSSFSSTTGITIVSAGGTNPDILQAARILVQQEYQTATVFTLAPNSPLADLARASSILRLAAFTSVAGKDGFLATNSLIQTMITMYRAYSLVYGDSIESTHAAEELLQTTDSPIATHSELLNTLSQPTQLVLFGGWAKTAAIDIESKFSECGLGSVLLSDYRNFAHGRHYGLDRLHNTVSIIALITPSTKSIAERVLSLIPSSIPVLRLTARNESPLAAIELVLQVLKLLDAAGEVQGIDAGRPVVPSYGRRLYRQGFSLSRITPRPAIPALPVRRKIGVPVSRLPREFVSSTESQLTAYLRLLQNQKFCGILFDYDGTLCDLDERFTGITAEMASHLTRLLRGGISLGVATGRGKSVQDQLRASISEEYWSRILVGYYNGSQIIALDGAAPSRSGQPPAALARFAVAIERHPQIAVLGDLEIRPTQLTLTPKINVPVQFLYQLLIELQRRLVILDASVMRSSHSVDIVSSDTSKLKVGEQLIRDQNAATADAVILCIGDKASWDGNDFAMLASPYSLTVDESPIDGYSCWNLAPIGARGVTATLSYLAAMQIQDNAIVLDVSKLRKAWL